MATPTRLPERSTTIGRRVVEEEFDDEAGGRDFVNIWSSRYGVHEAPKTKLGQRPVPASVAYQLIADLRQLDNNPRLNLASFVTTWMEPEAQRVIMESLNVNLIDLDEYPFSNDIHDRCVKMLAHLYHAPHPEEPVGTGTAGSSEAVMLAGLAFKRRWQARRKEQGLPIDKPNIVMGYNVQVVWEKFCNYFEVEARLVPLEEDCFVLTPEGARPMCDENTIAVVGILGSTYNGEYEDIVGLDRMVAELKEEKGWDIGVHVDAASGGFVAPFVDPELVWDFRLPNVRSINVSGHKYGLVYPGVGWVLWREKEDLPEDMVFHINYLGADQASVTLNFSRPAAFILAQYYQLVRLGREGYTRIMTNLTTIGKHFEKGLLEMGHFKILNKPEGLPLVAFSLIKTPTTTHGLFADLPERTYDEFDLADKLREKGWVLPAYTMAPNAKCAPHRMALVSCSASLCLWLLCLPQWAAATSWSMSCCSFLGSCTQGCCVQPARARINHPAATVSSCDSWCCTVASVALPRLHVTCPPTRGAKNLHRANSVNDLLLPCLFS